jgi:hypothetical protein
MAKKQLIKKITKIKKEKNDSYLKIPLIGTIIFSLLLVTSSFFAGAAWIKIKNGGTSSKLTSENTFSAIKNNKPQLDFYVMSFCPYGNQMETTLRPIFDLLGDKVELRPRYIFDKIEGNLTTYCKSKSPDPTQCETYVANSGGQLKSIADCQQQIATMVKTCNNENQYLKIGDNLYSSLHGRIEANQDVREICAYNLAEDKKLWWDFVENVNINCNLNNADTCWEEQAQKAGLDANKITECFNKDAGSLIEKEIAATTKYQIQGSPTLMIGEQAFPPEIDPTSTDQNIKIGKEVFSLNQVRTPNVIKEALCTGFKKAPKECKTILDDPAAEAGQAADATGGC